MAMGVRPIRFTLPAGMATVVGALPQVAATEWSNVVREMMPTLPSAHTVTLDSVDDDPSAFAPVVDFLESMVDRAEPLVLSLTGPVSLQLALTDRGVDPASAAAAASRTVRRGADRLVSLAESMVPKSSVLLFLDEPRLANSMHPTYPLGPEMISSAIGDVVDAVDDRAMVGVAVDGRADWAMLLSTGISILGASPSAHLETAAAELSSLFERGGFVAWAAVPTDEPLGDGTDRLWRRLSAAWSDLAGLGVDPLLLRERSIITPAAGLGSFGVAQAERVLQLAVGLSERVMNQVIGARLSVGA